MDVGDGTAGHVGSNHFLLDSILGRFITERDTIDSSKMAMVDDRAVLILFNIILVEMEDEYRILSICSLFIDSVVDCDD